MIFVIRIMMAQGKPKKNLVIATTIAVIATALAIAPTVLSNVVIAQANKQVQGFGQGTVTCPSSFPPPQQKPGATISFGASKNKGTVSNGFWNIFQFGGKQGQITGGSVGAQNFQLTGFETSDSLCLLASGASITIRGQCGTGVTIEFEASNGERGTFVGNVNCS